MLSLTMLWAAWLATVHPGCTYEWAHADDPMWHRLAVACLKDDEVKYDANGWRTPPGPPPENAISLGAMVHHCGNTFTITRTDESGQPVTMVFQDRPCGPLVDRQ